MMAHQERVIEERRELVEKLEKLKAFFSSPVYDKLETDEQARLQEQSVYMDQYAEVLQRRIAAF